MSDSASPWTTAFGYLLLIVVAIVSIPAMVEADVPNRFQKNRSSASGISTGVYSCREPLLKQRQDLSKRFGWRYCGCFIDWMEGRFTSEVNAETPDLAALERKLLGHPDLKAAVQKCINFALRTENQSGLIRSPYTPPGEPTAVEIARRFDKCYFPRAKREGWKSAMMYCTCKVDAERAGYSSARIAELCK